MIMFRGLAVLADFLAETLISLNLDFLQQSAMLNSLK